MTASRPVLLISATFVASMYMVAILGAGASFAVIFCAFLTLIIYSLRTKKIKCNIIYFISFAFLCLGVYMYISTSSASLRPAFPYCEKDVTVIGEVTGDVNAQSEYVSFEINTHKIGASKCDEKIPLIYFKEAGESFVVPKRGDVISAVCKLSLPDRAMNTGGFDYSAYLKTKGIYFQGVCDAKTLTVKDHNEHIIMDSVSVFRNKCNSFFDNTFPQEEGAVLKAYILGDKNSLSPDASEMFSASGLSHVLAVSGMHVVIFISCLVSFLTLVKVPKQKQRIISALAVIFFVMFTGASTSSIRAAAMSFIAIFAKYVFKRADSLTSLFFVAACFCLKNPQIIFEASFMLSFGATLGILLFAEKSVNNFSMYLSKLKSLRLRNLLKSLIDLICVGVSAQVFTIPILIYLFKSFSLVSAIATIVVTPILAPMLIGGLLFTFISFLSPYIALPFAGFIFLCARILNIISGIFASFPFSKISYGLITPFLVLIYVLVLMVFLFVFTERNKKGYFISLYSIVFLSLVYLFSSFSLATQAEVTFINVGEGDCSLIKAPGNCDILIDSGGANEDYSTGKNIIKPYLLQNGVYDIEYAVATHGHEDHVNGLIGLLDTFKIKNIIVPKGFGLTDAGKALLQKAEEKDAPILTMKRGNTLKIGDKIELLAIMPDDKIINFTDENDENDRSLMLKLSYGKTSFLFTGDITSNGEDYTVSKYSDFLSADVLKIPHHGSKYSSTESFIKSVSPQFAYIPTGENIYGHPHDEVLERLKNNNVIYYRGDIERDVTFYFDSNRITGIKYGGNYDLR